MFSCTWLALSCNFLFELKVFWSLGWCKTCSYPFVQYFCTLFWDDITTIWEDNNVYFFTEKKNVLDQQIIIISSQTNVRKYRTKEHEQVYCVRFFIFEISTFQKWSNRLAQLISFGFFLSSKNTVKNNNDLSKNIPLVCGTS